MRENHVAQATVPPDATACFRLSHYKGGGPLYGAYETWSCDPAFGMHRAASSPPACLGCLQLEYAVANEQTVAADQMLVHWRCHHLPSHQQLRLVRPGPKVLLVPHYFSWHSGVVRQYSLLIVDRPLAPALCSGAGCDLLWLLGEHLG